MLKKPSQELDHESTDLSGTTVEEEVHPSIVVSDRAEHVDELTQNTLRGE